MAVSWFLLSLHQYLLPLQASVTKILSFECVGQSWRKLICGFFFSGFLSPWPSFFFFPWFHFCLLQKVHCYSAAELSSSSFLVIPEKGTTLFHPHLAHGHFSHQHKCWLQSLHYRLCPFSTTPVLLSTVRSWPWHISVPNLLLWAVWDPYLHPPLLPVQANTFPGAARQCPTLLGPTALLCCLEVLLVTQSCMHWGYRPTQCVITFHWPLLSCIQALPSVSHWEWVVISPGWGLPYSFFSVYIKYVTQGSWSKDRAFKHCVCINNYPSLHKVMRMPICSPAPYLHGKCSLSEYRELGCAPISAFRDHLSILSVSRPTELTVKPHEQCVCGINCPGNTIH